MSRRRIRISTLALLLLAFFYAPGRPGPDRFLWNPIGDAAHFPLFFIITLLLYYEVTRKRILPAVGIGILLTVVIEWIQPMVGRSASIVDIINGIAGVLAAAYCIEFRRFRFGVLVIGQLVVLLPAMSAYRSYHHRGSIFPILSDFSSSLQDRLWTAVGETAISIDRSTPCIQFQSGAEYAAGDSSWVGYNQLVLEIENRSSTQAALKIRIDDSQDSTDYGQRFNATLSILPGVSTISIPLAEIEAGPISRKLDLSAIRRLLLFTNSFEAETSEKEPTRETATYCLHRLYLH